MAHVRGLYWSSWFVHFGAASVAAFSLMQPQLKITNLTVHRAAEETPEYEITPQARE
jgi:hypothetical protein